MNTIVDQVRLLVARDDFIEKPLTPAYHRMTNHADKARELEYQHRALAKLRFSRNLTLFGAVLMFKTVYNLRKAASAFQLIFCNHQIGT